MIITIEPMLNIGSPDAEIMQDGWTALTLDRSLSAQFEHTIAVLESGYEILTARSSLLKNSEIFSA
jgi:methionyl aminopeptidase